MKKILKKDVPNYRKIRAFALGDMHRINAASADCYAFYVAPKGTRYMDGTIADGKDWSGGWDWSKNIIDQSATHIMMLDSGDVYEL